ncbi:ABC transporter permease [Bacillus sp. HMF5848]|uniref:ABC transporter permease n=1 Tax=Bacillus sp. HMF5848 TaxID=2495421 RepID=UPI000F7B3EF5|nr:ABC transporter permease [Bacillus sp. HMF5848]RSK26061.1 ABC transporter permease [Bacillus sp. HMF5848]
MKSFHIAWKDFIIRFLDRKSFLLMIVMPVLLTAILGSALAGVMNGNIDLPTTNVGVISGDDDILSTNFQTMLNDPEITELIVVTKVSDPYELTTLLESDKIDVGIELPLNWSEKLASSYDESLVKLYVDPGKELQGDIVQSIVSSYTKQVASIYATTNIVVEDLFAQQKVQADVNEVVAAVANPLDEKASNYENIVTGEPVGKKAISGMQYYAAGMGVMFLLFSAMNGAKSILQERHEQTLARMMITPTSSLTILVGKFLGTLYYTVIQFTIFLLATTFIFGVDWGEDVLQVIAVSSVYAVSVAGLSILLAAVVRDEKTADGFGSIGVQILALLGGSMIPLNTFPNAIQKIADFTPNKWALEGFLNIMEGTSWDTLLLPIAILLCVGLSAVVVGTWRLIPR